MNTTVAAGKSNRVDVKSSLLTAPNRGRAWWFLGTLAVLRNPDGAPLTPTIIELTIPPGGSPPQHIHNDLDDNFLLLDGEVVIRCGEHTEVAQAGSYVVLPAGVDHTFCVTSSTPARMLLIHATAEFLEFIEAVGTPAKDLRLPPPGETSMDRDALIRVAEKHGIRIIGSPLQFELSSSAAGSSAQL